MESGLPPDEVKEECRSLSVDEIIEQAKAGTLDPALVNNPDFGKKKVKVTPEEMKKRMMEIENTFLINTGKKSVNYSKLQPQSLPVYGRNK